jgi:hypothetical protein
MTLLRASLGRRAALVQLAGFGLATAIGSPVLHAADGDAVGRELLVDPGFQRGFRLCEPEPGKRVVYGELRGFDAGPPAWDLDQWSSRDRLASDPASELPAADVQERRWANTAKAVVLQRAGTGSAEPLPTLEFGVMGSVEYGGRARQDGEPWVHLLAEQALAASPTLAELRRARFRIQAQLRRSKLHRTSDYSTGRHAAQFQVFLALQNVNPASAGKGRLVWFGIPLYDDRHRIPPEHKTRDTGGTGMFIFTPRGDVYASASAHDGGWITVDRDLVPLLRESLTAAWDKGFLVESRDLSDYRLTSINLGWEVPGMLDVALAIRGLSLRVE